MPCAGPSREQRHSSQTQTQCYGRGQRRADNYEEEEEEVLGQLSDDKEDPGLEDSEGQTQSLGKETSIDIYLKDRLSSMSTEKRGV
jgi:hypothetical protein